MQGMGLVRGPRAGVTTVTGRVLRRIQGTWALAPILKSALSSSTRGLPRDPRARLGGGMETGLWVLS